MKWTRSRKPEVSRCEVTVRLEEKRKREREKEEIGRRLVVLLRNDLRALSVLLFPTLAGKRESSTTCRTMRTAATPGGGP